MESKLQNESPMDIIMSIRNEFKEEYRQKISDITKIIFQRISIDDQARQIAKSLMVDEGINYVEAVFDRAMEIGRFAGLNAHDLAVLINSIRIFTLFNWIIDPSPDSMTKLVEDEMALYQYASGALTDLKPPVK